MLHTSCAGIVKYLLYLLTSMSVTYSQVHNIKCLLQTLGAVDGKHFRIQKPTKSGSAFYNYKGFFSVAIMAVVDHDYRFRMVDASTYRYRAICESISSVTSFR